MDMGIITENAFFTYLIATMKVNNCSVINKYDIERQLYSFYNSEDFNMLFNNIPKKEIANDKYIDLNSAFNDAISIGLISLVKDFGDIRYKINITVDEAEMILSQNTIIAKKMREMCSGLYTKEDILFDDYKQVDITKEIKLDVFSNFKKYETLSTKVKTSKFYNDEGKSIYINNSLNRPLPGSNKAVKKLTRRKDKKR